MPQPTKLLQSCVNCVAHLKTGSVLQYRWISTSFVRLSLPEPSSTTTTPPQPKEKLPKRKYAKKTKLIPVLPVKKDSSSGVLPPTAKKILDYIKTVCGQDNQSGASLISRRFLKHSTHPTCVYLIDDVEATKMASLIKQTNPDLDATVLELHAGLGLLTSKLLSTVKFKHVSCLEDHAPLAERLIQTYDVSVIDCSADDIPRHHHLDKHDSGERINSILTSITPGTSSHLYITGTIPNVSTINFLIRSFVTKRIFFEDDLPWSDVSLLVAVGPKPEFICMATPESGKIPYRPTSVLFQTLFTSKTLGTFPRNAFIPWETVDTSERKGPRKRKLNVDDPDHFKLMQIEINHDVVNEIGKENLFPYWYFVRHHLFSRTMRVIPELERWIPGCGVKLIKQGFNIYSQFGEMSPQEVLNLYLEFTSWPEFAGSSYLSAVEKYQTRLELSDEEDAK